MHTRLLVLCLLGWTSVVVAALVALPGREDRASAPAFAGRNQGSFPAIVAPRASVGLASDGRASPRGDEPVRASPIPLAVALYAVARHYTGWAGAKRAVQSPPPRSVPAGAGFERSDPPPPEPSATELRCGPWEPLVQGPLEQRVRRCELRRP